MNPTRLNKQIRELLSKHGDKLIERMKVCRTPVSGLVQSALNVVSLGAFKKRIAKSSYDEIFHLYLVIQVKDGTTFTLEKNAIIELNQVSSSLSRPKEECRPVPGSGEHTLNSILAAAEQKMGKRFYTYSAKSNNCQDFLLAILTASQLGNEEIYSFIKQDTRQLFKDDTYLRKLTNSVTKVGSFFTTLIRGGVYLTNADGKLKAQTKKPYASAHNFRELPIKISINEIKDMLSKKNALPKKKRMLKSQWLKLLFETYEGADESAAIENLKRVLEKDDIE
jgi:hypothetical protein